VTDKKALLEQVRRLAAEGLLSREELEAAFAGAVSGDGAQSAPRPHAGVSDVLYYIGGAVVFFGIAVLVWQNWTALPKATKILCTLGSALAAYWAGVLLARDERFEMAARAFYFVSGLVLPLGIQMTFHLAGLDVASPRLQALAWGLCFGMFAVSDLVSPRPVFTLFAVIFGTMLFFAATAALAEGHPFTWRFAAYRTLVAGAALAALGHAFQGTSRQALTGALYGLGGFAFLGAALALGDWKPNQNVLWELVFPALAFGAMFLGVTLRSKSFLTFGSGYLMLYIFKITSQYFSGSIGWPLVLIVTGLGLIAVGYLHWNLKRKYLS
jgi:hypothetical protein